MHKKMGVYIWSLVDYKNCTEYIKSPMLKNSISEACYFELCTHDELKKTFTYYWNNTYDTETEYNK